MKACWNCGRQLENPEEACPMCGAAVPVIAPEPEEAPRRRAREDAPRRETYSLTQAPGLASQATHAVGSVVDAVGPVLRVFVRLADSALKNPQAALVLAASLLVIFYMSTGGAAPQAVEFVHCWTMNDAQKTGLLLRQALPEPPVIEWGGRKIPIQDAWVGEIGEYRSGVLFGSSRYIHPSGRFRLYFRTPRETWPESPQFYVGLPARLVEAIPTDATPKPSVLHHVDVEPKTATPLTVMVKDPARKDAGMQTLTFH
jgi:hypothetical protein